MEKDHDAARHRGEEETARQGAAEQPTEAVSAGAAVGETPPYAGRYENDAGRYDPSRYDAGRHGLGAYGSPTPRVQEEGTWSVLSHLSMLLNLVTGFLGPVAALVVWLVYRDRSPRIAFHALQSMWYQVAWLLILAAGWTVTGLLTVVLIGFLLIPVMAVLSIVPFAHAAYAAYRVSSGEDYRYPLVADLIQNR